MTPDLSYTTTGKGAREWCEDNKWDEEKKKGKGMLLLLPHPFPGFFYLYACQFFYCQITYFSCSSVVHLERRY